MNERIKELMLKAGFNQMGIWKIIGIEQYHEKFAELIVKECATLLEKEANSSHDEGTESYNTLIKESQWIKRYFGVE